MEHLALSLTINPQLDSLDEENQTQNGQAPPQPQQPQRPNRRHYVDAADENRKSGNLAFEAGDFKKAVESYSRAIMLKIHEGPTASDVSENGRKKRATTALLYSNRACCLIRMAAVKLQQDQAASTSNSKPMFTSMSLQEPSCLELLAGALSDAERALSLRPDWIKAWIRRGQACMSMRMLKESIESYRRALTIDPSNLDARRGIIEAQSMLGVEAATLRSYVQYLATSDDRILQHKFFSEKHGFGSEAGRMDIEENQSKSPLDDFECVLCAKLYWQPITTPCGHTFCKECLLKAMQYGGSCPLCRTVIHGINKTSPVSVILQNLIQKNFPEEYKRREQEALNDENLSNTCLPLLIVNAVVYPNMPLPLHIFEPRYILMLRRCMSSQKTFGLVSTKRGPNGEYEPHNAGCALLITACNTLPDGRSYIDTVGTRRFKINETWTQDDYMVGRISWIDDEPMTETEEQTEIDELVAFFRSLYETCASGKESLQQSLGLKNILHKAGAIPSNPTEFSFWLAHHLPMPLEMKQDLLGTTSTLERLRYLRAHLASTSLCNIM